jgi:metal-sulfur cluster biosynthetic enzyme
MTESATTPSIDDLTEAMRDVVDPELGINVVDLGLVYGINVDAEKIAIVDMTLTSAACPLTDVIEDQTKVALGSLLNCARARGCCCPGPRSASLRGIGLDSSDATVLARRRSPGSWLAKANRRQERCTERGPSGICRRIPAPGNSISSLAIAS